MWQLSDDDLSSWTDQICSLPLRRKDRLKHQTTYSSRWHQVQYGFVHDANKPEKAVLLDASWVGLHALHGNVKVRFSNSMVLVVPGLSWHSLPGFRFGAYYKSHACSTETASTNFWSKSADSVVLHLKQHHAPRMAKLQTQGSEMRHKAQLALQLLGQHVENRDSMLLSNEFRMTLPFSPPFMDYNILQWFPVCLLIIFIDDYVHWWWKFFWPSCWDRFPRTTGGIFRVSQDLRWETPKFSKDSNASKGCALPWSSTLEGPSFAANILNKKNNTKKHRHRVVAIFFKTNITRHIRHISHSIVMVASKARLSNQNCLDLSSWQCQVCSCEDPPVLGTCSKQLKKNKCGTIVLHISQLSHRGSDGTNKGPLSFDCFGIIEMPKKDPLEKQNMSTCHVMKNQLWRVDLFLL